MKCSSKVLMFAIAIMISCLGIGFFTGNYQFPQADSYKKVFVSKNEILHETDVEFLSVALDTSFMKCKIHELTEKDWQKLEEITELLTPGYLRLGGTAADQLIFQESEEFHEKDENNKNCSNEILQNELLKVSEKDWLKINGFANKTKLKFIFDFNVLLRSPNGWNSSNAEALLKFSQQNGLFMDFQLGNEPDTFEHKFNITVSGKKLAKDFNKLRHLLNTFEIYKHSKLLGPDVTRPKHLETSSLKYLKEFLSEINNSLSAVSWHQYYLNGRTAHLEDFIDPETFNVFPLQVDAVKRIVREFSSTLPIWISETSSAYGSGAPGLSDRYVASFIWLDKLGVSARSGISVVIRQSILQGNYALIDSQLSPSPDFWISYFYKKLVGTKVLNVLLNNENDTDLDYVRFYAHCSIWNQTDPGKGGEVVVYALNFSNTTEKFVLSGIEVNYPIYLFQFSAKNENLTSKYVVLNERKLVYDKELLENLLKYPKKVKLPLVLPGYSIAFWIFRSPFVNLCD